REGGGGGGEGAARRWGTVRHRAAGSTRRRARRLPVRRRRASFYHAPSLRLPCAPRREGRRLPTDPGPCHATTLTILCGTTITFLGGLPSSARFTASSAKTAVSISVFAAFRATVTSPRFLPLIWTGSVIVFSTRSSPSSAGQASDATSVLGPRAAQHSSAKCGTMGWNSRTRTSAASRTAHR